jgi:two-component system OmpR family response regulator
MRLLVVEDDPDLLRLISTMLREEGYAVDTAADGEEASYKVRAWSYDLIVLDVMLPKLDGWEVLRRVRKQHKTPVLMLTARDTVADRVRGLDTGADDYLVKPFAQTELVARIRALIRRSMGQARSEIVIGEVRIDTVAKSVTRRGKPISLTAMEYSLVELMAVQRGKLVTRTAIYEHLFDETNDSLSNLVDVHVSNIRKKLGKDFITTRRGLGYMIEE